MTIVDAIKTVLAEKSKPLTAREVYDAIVARSLFQFKSQSAASIVRAQLRRHCDGVNNQNAASQKLFRLVQGDRYELLDAVKRP